MQLVIYYHTMRIRLYEDLNFTIHTAEVTFATSYACCVLYHKTVVPCRKIFYRRIECRMSEPALKFNNLCTPKGIKATVTPHQHGARMKNYSSGARRQNDHLHLLYSIHGQKYILIIYIICVVTVSDQYRLYRHPASQLLMQLCLRSLAINVIYIE